MNYYQKGITPACDVSILQTVQQYNIVNFTLTIIYFTLIFIKLIVYSSVPIQFEVKTIIQVISEYPFYILITKQFMSILKLYILCIHFKIIMTLL